MASLLIKGSKLKTAAQGAAVFLCRDLRITKGCAQHKLGLHAYLQLPGPS